MSPRGGLALTVTLILLAGLGFVVSEGAAAPPVHNRAATPRWAHPAYERVLDKISTPTGWVNTVPFASSVTSEQLRRTDPFHCRLSHLNRRRRFVDCLDTSRAERYARHEFDSDHRCHDAGAAGRPESNNRIQFRIDTQQGATQVSPAYALLVDTVAPNSPLNVQSFPDTWTDVNTFRETWTNPADTSGIAGAYYRL